jgi:catechol 2,3-dioxygenase-like lactoylglutathione lyase family enzyme
MINGLHHNAYRCRDEETRQFYEEFLGLPLVNAFEIGETLTGRETSVLHSFYQMGEHIALEVDNETLHDMFSRGKDQGVETRGISDHGFIHSIYFRDPNGYVIELTAKVEAEEVPLEQQKQDARQALDTWQSSK